MYPPELKVLLDSNDWSGVEYYISSLTTPISIELKECLAWSYSRQNKYNDAIVLYNELLLLQPQNARWIYSKGYQYYAQKDYKTAIEYFEKALEIFPNYLIVKYRVSYAYIAISGTDNQWTKDVFWKAIKHLRDAHDIFKNYTQEEQEKHRSTYADICALHGKTLVNSSKYIDMAISLLEKSLKLKNDNDVQYQLSKAYYNKKEFDKALKTLPTAGKLPFYVLELRSQIYADCGQIEESTKILNQLLKFRKKDYIYYRISKNHLMLNNLDEAIKYALLALDSNKRSYKNLCLCGTIYYNRQEYRKAYNYLMTAREQRKKDYNLDLPEAIILIDKILELNLDLSISNEDRLSGVIIQYNSDRGFGFISSDTETEKIFFHISQLTNINKPTVGLKVTFIKEKTPKGYQAKEIEHHS